MNINKDHIMSNDVRHAIEEAMKKKFFNQVAFAKYLGVTQATVSRYLSGQTVPSLPILTKIGEALGMDLGVINKSYSHKENGGMFKIPFYPTSNNFNREINTTDNSLEYLYIDYGWIENMLNTNNTNDIFALRAVDDSMEPHIKEGDIIITRIQNNNKSYHGIYLVNYNGDYLIKKLQIKSKNLIKLISSNTEYDPIEVNFNDIDTELRIIGKIIGRINIKKF